MTKKNQRVLARQDQNSQEPSNTTSSKTVVSEADKIAAKLAASKANTKVLSKQKKKNKKQNTTIEPNNADEMHNDDVEIQDQDNIADETALAALAKAASNTTVLRSLDADAITIFYQQLIKGLKRCLEQNKEIFKVIHEIKVAQETFQKEVHRKIDNLSERIDQLMTPDDSYWKNLASRICKIQLSLLGLYPNELEFKKCLEKILNQEKPGYIEQLGSQWIHVYSGRIGPLCCEVIKSCRCDKAKDVRSAMFNIFGENNLTRINTSAGADDIRTFKNSEKTKTAFMRCEK